jgi:hypothetical protein
MKILLGKTEKSYYWTWLDGPDEMEPNTEQVYELVPVGELVGTAEPEKPKGQMELQI